MHELAPGLYQSRHRHGGEAWLYCVSGTGYSIIDEVRYDWEAGDLIASTTGSGTSTSTPATSGRRA